MSNQKIRIRLKAFDYRLIDQSALAYMLYHQKSFAHVNPGRRARNVSHSFGPWTTWFDCFQNWCSASVRSYQPLATQPCPRAGAL
jgi:hypothetical protein